MKNFTRMWMSALMLTAAFLLTQSTQSQACSIAGTASATKDSICVGGTTTLNLTGYLGAIQWQSFNGSIWVNETAPGSTTDSYSVSPTTTTEYRAVVTEPTCPSDISNTIIIMVGVTAPSTNGATRCGYGPVTLSANGGGIFKWYDAPTGGTPLGVGNSFTANVGSTTTFYCSQATSSGGSGTIPLPPQSTTYSSTARGYWFVAPSDFTITGLQVPPGTGATQNIAVVRFVPAVPPPAFATTTDDFVTLFLTQNDPTPGVIPVNIDISAGDVIGILGTRGADVNSYGTGPYTTVIDGQNVVLTRMGMQFPLASTPPQQLWTEVNGNISRVEITYETGCESSRTATVATVTAPPAMTLAANPPALCQGQSSQLSVTSSNTGYNYTWSPATGLSSTTGSTVTANPLSPITYTVIADDGTCGNIDSVFISVGPASVAGNAVISTDTICLGSNATLFLNGNTGNIQWQSNNGSGWVNETGTGSTTGQYLISPTAFTQYRAVVTSGGCDPDTSVTLNLEVLAITDPVAANDTICGSGTASLTGTGMGVMNWFTAPTGGNSVFTGNTYTPTVSTTTTYYVEASAGGTYNVGPPNLAMGTQFTVFGDSWGVQFDVTQQISLDRVYVSPGGTSGPLTINLRATQGGPILATKTVNVIAFTGLQPISLGWTINPGTGYRLEMGAGSVPLYYNSFGAAYPYTFAGSSVSITGFVNPNYATGNFYYFFYNWDVTEGCKSNRIPVTAVVQSTPTVPTISQFGTVLTSSVATNIQWHINGSPIPGATAQTYDMGLSGSGSYTVVVTDPLTGCTSESQPVLYTGLNDQLSAAGISMYPNPANDVLNFEFGNHSGEEIMVSVYDKTGKLVLSDVSGSSNRNIPLNIAAGTYSVEIKTSKGIYNSKLVKL